MTKNDDVVKVKYKKNAWDYLYLTALIALIIFTILACICYSFFLFSDMLYGRYSTWSSSIKIVSVGLLVINVFFICYLVKMALNVIHRIRSKIAFIFASDGIYNDFCKFYIKWNDIEYFKDNGASFRFGLVQLVVFDKILLVYVKNPDFYISLCKGYKKFLLKRYNKLYGTPIVLNFKATEFNFHEFKRLAEEMLFKYKKIA